MSNSYGKLVRDKIPDIIRKNGETPVTRLLSHEEYVAALQTKLKEEVAEYFENNSVEELADIVEVCCALAKAGGMTYYAFDNFRTSKRDTRGGFEKQIFLADVKPEPCVISYSYETGKEESEILGSGSNFSYVFTTHNEEEAMREVRRCGRNYLRRTHTEDGKRIRERYDFNTNEWREC